MKLFLIMFLSFSISSLVTSQILIDSPFVQKHSQHFEIEPHQFIGNIEENTSIVNPSIYKKSYLYEAPFQRTVRVTRQFSLDSNKHLQNDVVLSQWTKENNNWNIAIESQGNEPKIAPIRNNLGLHYPYTIQQFIGCNWAIIEGTPIELFESFVWHTEELNHEIIQLIEDEYLMVDDNGKLAINAPPPVKEFATEALHTILNDALVDQYAIAYNDESFTEELDLMDALRGMRSIKDKLIAFKTKEDYYINPINGNLTSAILALGIVGKSTTNKTQEIWFYYPQLRPILQEYYTDIDQEFVSFEYAFDQHLGVSTIEAYDRMSNEDTLHNDYEFFVDLDPLLAIEFWEENRKKINADTIVFTFEEGQKTCFFPTNKDDILGRVRQTTANGVTLYEGEFIDGYCDGEWRFYYPSGKIKAIRQYQEGKLNGIQENYYSNGELYATYTIENGILIELERYHSTGKLLEKGKFTFGIVSGNWEYQLASSPSEFQAIKANHIRGNNFKAVYQEGFFKFGVKYTQSFSSNCPLNFHGNTYNQFCLWAEYY